MTYGFLVVMACLFGMAHSGRIADGIFAYFRCEGNDMFRGGMTLEEICPDRKLMVEHPGTATLDFTFSVYVSIPSGDEDSCDYEYYAQTLPSDDDEMMSVTLTASEINSADGAIDVLELGSSSTTTIDHDECKPVCVVAYAGSMGIYQVIHMEIGVTDCSYILDPMDVSLEVDFVDSDTISLSRNDDGLRGFHMSEIFNEANVHYGSDNQLGVSEYWPHGVTVFMRPKNIDDTMKSSYPPEETCQYSGMSDVTIYDDPVYYFNRDAAFTSDDRDWLISPNGDFVALGVWDPEYAEVPRCPVCGEVVIYFVWDVFGEFWTSDDDLCDNFVAKSFYIDCGDEGWTDRDVIVFSPDPSKPHDEVLVKQCSAYHQEILVYYPKFFSSFERFEHGWESKGEVTRYERVRFMAARFTSDYYDFINGINITDCALSSIDHEYDGTFNGDYWPSIEYSYGTMGSLSSGDYAILDVPEPEYLQPPFDYVTDAMVESCFYASRRDHDLLHATDGYLWEACREMLYETFELRNCPDDNEFYYGITLRPALEYFTGTKPEQAFLASLVCSSDYRSEDIDVMSCGQRIATYFLRHAQNVYHRVVRDHQLLNQTDYDGNYNLYDKAGGFFKGFMNITDELDYFWYCQRPEFIYIPENVAFYFSGYSDGIAMGTPDMNGTMTQNCWTQVAARYSMSDDECAAMYDNWYSP